MKHTKKSVRALAATIITFGSLTVVAHAAITVSGGSVVYDSSNQLIEFTFTLTSNVVGESLTALSYDADGTATWNAPNAVSIFSSPSWTGYGIAGGQFFYGTLDNPLVFDGINGITIRNIFEGAVNPIGNIWQVSGGTGSGPLNTSQVLNVQRGDNLFNNLTVSSAVAGTVIPEPSSALLLGLSSLSLFARQRKR